MSQRIDTKGPKQLVVQANVTNDCEHWAAVPGELLKTYNDQYIYLRKQLTALQGMNASGISHAPTAVHSGPKSAVAAILRSE